MTRPLFAVLTLVALPAVAAAQPLSPLTGTPGTRGFGGGLRPSTPAPISPTVSAFNPNPLRVGGGVVGSPVVGGIGGGVGTGYPFPGWNGGWWNGGWHPNHQNPWFGFGYVVPVAYPVPVPVPVPTPVPEPAARARAESPAPAPLVNQFPAVLSMEFPAPAEVWLNGKKQEGEPAAEWTFTSPVLAAGAEYTFDVKARWTSGGKTFERARPATVAGGQRSRVIVVSGTEVRE